MGNFFYSQNSETSEAKQNTTITANVKKPRKPKEIQKLRSDGRDDEFYFKSYMHNFSHYQRIIVAIHHLQRVEKIHNVTLDIDYDTGEHVESVYSSFYFEFARMEDFELFSQVAEIFEAKADLKKAKTSEDNKIVCYLSKKPKFRTKTYLFSHINMLAYDKTWIQDIIPKMVGRERNNGAYYIRFLSFNDYTRDKIFNELESHNDVLSCEKKDFYVLYDKTEGLNVHIYAITCELR